MTGKLHTSGVMTIRASAAVPPTLWKSGSSPYGPPETAKNITAVRCSGRRSCLNLTMSYLHNISILHDVFFSLELPQARLFYFGKRATKLVKVVVVDHF